MAIATKVKKGAKVTTPTPGLSGTIRAVWKGQLVLGNVPFDVSVKKMLQSDPDRDGLQRLCSCCHQPFNRPTDKCAKGNAPWSAAAEKRGEKKLTPVVHGVLTADDKYVVIDPDVLEAIEHATALPRIEVDEVVDKASEATPGGFPLHLGVESYYVAADKDIAGSVEDFAVLAEALTRSDKVAVGKWTQRKDQMLVGIHAVGGVLVMTVVPFAPEVRAPDEATVKHQIIKCDEADVDAVLGEFDSLKAKTFVHDRHANTAIPERRAAIDKALKAAKAGRKPRIVRSAGKTPVAIKGGTLAERLAAGKGKAGKATRATRTPRAKS